ncbi:MAG: heavy metal translocating P-type ATPase [Prevotella sp.]|nr:heavy metal translocating P-type ATPase [Prevotella sp.]
MQKKTIPVIGLACSACSANVERHLRSLDGIISATVSLPTRTALVEWDENRITLEDMKREVSAIGYDLVIEADRSAAEIERRGYLLLRKKVIVSWVVALLVMAITMGWAKVGNRDVANQTAMLLAAFNMVYCGREFYVRAVQQLRHLTAGMDTLVALSTAIAFVFSVVNTFWGEQLWGSRGMAWHTYYDSSVMIITFVLTGRLLEERSRKTTAAAIARLVGLRPKTARLYQGEVNADDGTTRAMTEEVPIATISRGDVIEVRAGEKIPVDGTVTWATSFMLDSGAWVDEAMITGEPAPVLKERGATALAGTVVSQGRLRLRARKTGDDTTLAQIIRMVEEAQGSKAPVQRAVDRVAMVFVPAVVVVALATFVVWWAIDGNAGLPHAIMSAVAVLVIACPCALGLATPIALMVGIGKAADHNILIKDATALEKIRHVDAMVIDKTGTLTTANPAIDFTKADDLPLDERETLKPHAREAMEQLAHMGVEVYLMSGDKEEAVAFWAREAGITHYQSGVQPHDKEDLVRRLQQEGKCVAMVGDGINDSQALATADVSIAMGGGTDVAIDVAQMTLMGDDLRRIAEALTLSQKTVRLVRQNLFWAFLYNVVCIPLAAGAAHLVGLDFQITPMWASALMAFSSISVVLNSLRGFSTKRIDG